MGLVGKEVDLVRSLREVDGSCVRSRLAGRCEGSVDDEGGRRGEGGKEEGRKGKKRGQLSPSFVAIWDSLFEHHAPPSDPLVASLHHLEPPAVLVVTD